MKKRSGRPKNNLGPRVVTAPEVKESVVDVVILSTEKVEQNLTELRESYGIKKVEIHDGYCRVFTEKPIVLDNLTVTKAVMT